MTGQPTFDIQYGPYLIRRARAGDVDLLVQMLLDLQAHIEGSNPDLWRMNAEGRGGLKGQIAHRLRASDSCALVAEHADDGVVGVIFGRILANNRYVPSRAGQIDQAFVRIEHRRNGVASQLVAALCHFFAAEQVEDISLRYVLGNEDAAAFWSSIGFSARITIAGARRQTIEENISRFPDS